MCEKCIESTARSNSRDITSRITDEAMIRGINVLIARAKVQKAVLHPEKTK
jgi:hypothetical protein